MNALLTLTWMRDCTSAHSGWYYNRCGRRGTDLHNPTSELLVRHCWFDSIGSTLLVRPPPAPLVTGRNLIAAGVQRVAAARGRSPMISTFGGRLVGFVLPPALAGAVVTTIVPP